MLFLRITRNCKDGKRQDVGFFVPLARWASSPHCRGMRPLEHSLLTARLRIEPVTPTLALAAEAGQRAFSQSIGAEAPADWCAGSLTLVARSHGWRVGEIAFPTRAVAIHREAGVVVGDVRFEPVQGGEGEIEIGYSIARSRRRQGYAVEATAAVIDWLFEAGGAETLIAGCDSGNLASVRTLRRLGFWLDRTPGKTFWWLRTRDIRSATSA